MSLARPLDPASPTDLDEQMIDARIAHFNSEENHIRNTDR
jgi:hypothetical protein